MYVGVKQNSPLCDSQMLINRVISKVLSTFKLYKLSLTRHTVLADFYTGRHLCNVNDIV